MKEKPFKTHDELISLLESRGVDFSEKDSKSTAKKHLQRIGYYTLINGYSVLFYADANHTSYKPGTTIDEIYNIYIFDKRLREILLRYILPLEVNIKSLIAYHFPQHHPENNYLVYTNFDTSRKSASKNITDLLSEIQRQIAYRVTDPSISHYLTEYGYIPLWVLNNILTFGTISKFYSVMQQQERQLISKTFKMSDNELESILAYLSSVRNFCAHGNRLYCFRSKRPLPDNTCHIDMKIPKTIGNEYEYGKRDLFAAYIALKLVSAKTDYRKLIKETDIAIKNLSARLKTISSEAVLEKMGFPLDWKIKLLQK